MPLLSTINTVIGVLSGSGSAAVSIGSVTLQGIEVPAEIARTGEMQTVVHRLVGGAKIVNVLGPDPGRRQWTGILQGPGALARGRTLEALRDAGQPVVLTVLGYRELVVVRSLTIHLQQRGYVIPYSIEMEVVPQPAASGIAGTSALSSLLGSGIASAVSSFTAAVSSVASFAANALGQVDAVASQVAPIANMTGAGGILSSVTNDLTGANAIAAGTSNIAAVPSSLASLSSSVGSAGADLMTTAQSAGAALSGFTAGAGALAGTAAASGALASSVQAGGLVNQAAANIALAQGGAAPTPLFRSGGTA